MSKRGSVRCVWRAPSGVMVLSSAPPEKQGGLFAAWSYAFRKYGLGRKLGG